MKMCALKNYTNVRSFLLHNTQKSLMVLILQRLCDIVVKNITANMPMCRHGILGYGKSTFSRAYGGEYDGYGKRTKAVK